jgi:hypothetical protein
MSVEAAAHVSPLENPQQEVIRFLLNCINLKQTGNDQEDAEILALFQSSYISRMIRILNQIIANKETLTSNVFLFVDSESAEYLFKLFVNEKRLDMMKVMEVCKLSGLTSSGPTETDVAELSEGFSPFSSRNLDEVMSTYVPTKQSQDDRMDIELTGGVTEEVQSSIHGTLENSAVGISNALQGISVAIRQSEQSRSPADVAQTNRIQNGLRIQLGCIQQIFEDNLEQQQKAGYITAEERQLIINEHSERISNMIQRMQQALNRKNLTDLPAAMMQLFLQDSVRLGPRIDVITAALNSRPATATVASARAIKAGTVAVAAAFGGFVASLSTSVSGGCRGLFNALASYSFGSRAQVAEPAFNNVVDAAAADRPLILNNGNQAVASAAAAAAAAIDVVSPQRQASGDAEAAVIELAARGAAAVERAPTEALHAAALKAHVQDQGMGRVRSASHLENAGEDGEQIEPTRRVKSASDRDNAGKGGKRRSRRNSSVISKRIRRKSTTKKQKSKKNKRQSRRKARRSSSRKADRK